MPRRGWIASYRGALCLSVWLALAYPCAGRVYAQAALPALEESAAYRATVEEAVREFEEHNYGEARALFEQAHALYPNARTERGLGFAEFELRNYGPAIAHLEAALVSSVKPLTPELRQETEELLARARGFVASVHVEVKPKPGALLIDGVRVAVPEDQTLLLTVGEHTLEARAPGFVTERRKLSIRGGEEQQLTLILAQQQRAPETTKQRSWYKSPWLWASVGVVVAGAATATGIVLTRSDEPPAPYGGSANGVLSGP